METSVLTSKGQLLIPKRIRNKYGIRTGVRVAFLETPQGVVIKPMDTAYFESFAGLYKDSLPSAEEYKEWRKVEGKLEEEKTYQQVAEREFYEEINLKIKNIKEYFKFEIKESVYEGN